MPFGTARIPLHVDAPYHSCAQFISFIAYPDPADVLRRQELLYAAAIWAIRVRASEEPEWAEQPQPIVPLFFAGPLERVAEIQKRGAKLLMKRMVCAKEILLPALCEVHGRQQIRVNGLSPTLENILREKVLPLFGLGFNTGATFKNRVWGPSRSVAPAALALWAWMQSRVGDGEKLNSRILVELFFSIDHLREVLDLTKGIRLLADSVVRYEVRKSHTMRFVEVASQNWEQEKSRDQSLGIS